LERFDEVWLWDDSESDYVDLTDNIRVNTDFIFISDASDKLYMGFSRRWIGLFSDLTTYGSYTALSYDYFDGTDWKKLSLIDSYQFDSSKYIRWLIPKDWVKYNFTSTSPHAKDPPNTKERYWVRISVSAVATAAVVNKFRLIPYAQYATPEQVAKYLQVKVPFNSSTRPTDLAVEEIINRVESRIDYRTHKSWKFNPVVEESSPVLVDFNRYGMFPRFRNLAKVYGVYMWTGSEWQKLIEGRNNDYLVNYDLGMIYLTRLFSMPATYGMTGRYYLYGFGEFKNSIKIDYAYGKESEVDSEFGDVHDVAIMMAAIELLTHSDYSGLVVSGTDKVSYSDKLERMEKAVEAQLDELTAAILS
jgi:hypothetical protein